MLSVDMDVGHRRRGHPPDVLAAPVAFGEHAHVHRARSKIRGQSPFGGDKGDATLL